jgi:glucans biosynthesis protein C
MQNRISQLDNLRALAMLLGIIFHASMAYSPLLAPILPTADPVNAHWVDVLMWFSHLFRMPLFFMLSGYFCALLVVRHGVDGMLKNRAMRIGLVLLVALPLVLYLFNVGVEYALANVQNLSPMLQFIEAAPNANPAPISTTHLWFLYYLLLLSLVYWCLAKLELIDALGAFCTLHKKTSAALLITTATLALLSVPAPHPAPESVLPQFWALAFYGCFFALGQMVFRQADLMKALNRYLWHGVVLALVIYAAGCAWFAMHFYALSPQQKFAYVTAPYLQSWHWPLAALAALVSITASIVCWLAAERWLTRTFGVFRTLTEASYWIYVWHLPVLFFIQYCLLDQQWPALLKFAFACAMTVGVCWLSFLPLRKTAVGRLLGARTRLEHPGLTR